MSGMPGGPESGAAGVLHPSWTRVVLKLSGGLFAGAEPLGISPDVVAHIAAEIIAAVKDGVQVAAARPLYLTREDLPAEVVEKERRIAEQITRDEGKPEQAIPKIVEGRLNSYFKDVVLVEQPFVKDNKTTIKQVLAQANLTVTGFARFQVGQA